MIALLTTTDQIKLSAVRAILADAGIAVEVFDAASGSLLQQLIPLRLMVGEEDARAARHTLRQAGFVEAGDGDWDLAPEN